MDLYTSNIRLHKPIKKLGLVPINTTRKSGDPAFAPTWELLTLYLSGAVKEEEYTARFTEQMRESFQINKKRWVELCASKRPIAIYCYCKHGCFCHRRILVTMLSKVCDWLFMEFKYHGEIIGVENEELVLQAVEPIGIPPLMKDGTT